MKSGSITRSALLGGLALLVAATTWSGCAAAPAAALELIDLDGRVVDPLSDPEAAAHVFIFVRSDCPISNRYAPEIARLSEKFAARGVTIRLVYPDPEEGPEDIRQHLAEYSFGCEALRDPQHSLVSRTEATITPEAVVFLPDGRLVYRGRINDRYVAFGKARPAPTRHDLEQVLEATLRGDSLAFTSTPAVGCFIRDLSPDEG